jgi:hypothetical protein
MEIKSGTQLTLDKIMTNQSYTPTYEDIFPKVKAILMTVNQAIEVAIPGSKEFFETKEKIIDRYLFPHLVRFFLKDQLETIGLSVKMEEEEEPITDYLFKSLTNNGLMISYNGFRLKILKADNGDLPVPYSDAKSKYYNQQLPLIQDFPSDSKTVCPNLIILWEINSNYDFLQLRLACPKSGYKTRDSVKAYFNEPVPHTAELIKTTKQEVIEEDLEVVKKEVDIKETDIQ